MGPKVQLTAYMFEPKIVPATERGRKGSARAIGASSG